MMSLVLEDIEDEQRMEMLLVEDDNYIAGAKSSSTDNHAGTNGSIRCMCPRLLSYYLV